MFAAAIFAAAIAAAPEDFDATRAALLQRVQCARQSDTPAGDGMGRLWGCYGPGDAVKLWVTAQGDGPALQRVKLASFAMNGERFHVAGRLWAGVVSDVLGLPPEAGQAFAACEPASGERWRVECVAGRNGRQSELIAE